MTHTASKAMYYRVFAALMVLTAATVGISFVELGALNVTVALLVAITKATLVMLFFMHLLHSNRLTWLAMLVAIYFFAIMMVLTYSDYGARGWLR